MLVDYAYQALHLGMCPGIRLGTSSYPNGHEMVGVAGQEANGGRASAEEANTLSVRYRWVGRVPAKKPPLFGEIETVSI